MRCERNQAGFTLIEVLAALAILGTAMFILLNAHYSALALHQQIDEQATFRHLMESAVGIAELEIRTGNLADSGDFGTRYPGYAWFFEATAAGSDPTILLYQVQVVVRGPETERQLEFYVYDTGVASLLDTGASASGRGASSFGGGTTRTGSSFGSGGSSVGAGFGGGSSAFRGGR